MPKNEGIYLGHMLDMAQKAVDALEGKSRAQFDQDEILRAAISHFLQTIGEAASKVSKEVKEKNPSIPWEDIIGMRHKIVHDYMTVDYDIVWDAVKTEIPPLLEKLKKITQ